MKITIAQVDIETAIRNHILSTINVNADMELGITLAAKRGQGGFEATIDIRPIGSYVEPVKTATVKAQAALTVDGEAPVKRKGGRPRKIVAEVPTVLGTTLGTVSAQPTNEVAPVAVQEEVTVGVETVVESDSAAIVDELQVDEPAAAAVEVDSAPAPARSLFGNISRPINV